MLDEMFFSKDRRSLRRGNRKAPRTETCRPCLVWTQDAPDTKYRGVVMDISRAGMRIRMLEILPVDTRIQIQLMRDEGFRVPLSVPVEGDVVRFENGENGFNDHGVALQRKELPQRETPLVRPDRGPDKSKGITPPRVYTLNELNRRHRSR